MFNLIDNYSYYTPLMVAGTLCCIIFCKIYNFGVKFFENKLLEEIKEKNHILKQELKSRDIKINNQEQDIRGLRLQINSLEKEKNELEIAYKKIFCLQARLNRKIEMLYKNRRELLLGNTSKTRYLYHKDNLCNAYVMTNKNNPARTKPLYIMKLFYHDKPKLNQCLKIWYQAIDDQMRTPLTPEISVKLNATKYIMDQIPDADHDKAAAVDEYNNIQAICVFSEDESNVSACKIHYLVSSPLQEFQGAGTALIQYVIERALSRQKLRYENSIEIVEGEVAITLLSLPESKAFYQRVGFVDYEGDFENMILQGNKLVEFLKNYGGRYLF